MAPVSLKRKYEIIIKVDEAFYRVKDNGRNQVQVTLLLLKQLVKYAAVSLAR